LKISLHKNRYSGQYEDTCTGLYYNRFRYYDPEIGQYTQVDPIGLTGGNPTLYGYVFNPFVKSDPFGLNPLRTALGLSVGEAMQAHHLIPNQVYNQFKPLFDAIGHSQNAASNGLALANSPQEEKKLGQLFYHNGPHPNTSDAIRNQIRAINNQFNQGLISAQDAKNQVTDIQNSQRSRLSQGGAGRCPIRVS